MENLIETKDNFDEKLNKIDNLIDLEEIRVEYLGKKGIITTLLTGLKDVAGELKRDRGIEINNIKTYIQEKLEAFKQSLSNKLIQSKINKTKTIDISAIENYEQGTLHPVTKVEIELIEIFKSMGFTVEDGNEIETEYNNFEAVNVSKNHPARDMQDTFWLENGQLLKTHTSASQNRLLKKYGAPSKVIFPGRCFRNESLDASHDNTFFQLEGMVVSETVNVSNLIYFMKTMLSKVFNQDIKVRLRPGFFPFVEPGFELDASCPFCGGKGCKTCKSGGWIELCPCGMIHPKVLEMGGIDTTKYRGFAFGLGLTRLAMMKNGINDIRLLNNTNLKFLKQNNK